MSLNKHKIIPLIESYYHTFTPLERTIADFFIHNTEEQDFSSRNISGLLYVSEASLSRFAQKCGFHGYREFIYEYKQRLAPGPEENIPNFEVSEFNTYQELLNKSNALLDKAQITRITNLLVSKPRVYVYGRGSSGLVAQEMKLRFMRIGLNKLIFNRLPNQRQRQNPDCVGNQSHDSDIDIIIVHQHFPPLSLPGTG